jgi:hypothetical protein
MASSGTDYQGDEPHNAQDRPQVNVPKDPSYNLNRYLDPQSHPDDKLLRAPVAFREPTTVKQSRNSMAAIINALVPKLPPHLK